MDITKRKITKIAREVSKFTVRTLRAEGVGPGEFDVLHAIRKNPGITQAGVCRITGFDKGAVARQTASLEAKDYLRREANPADGRSRCLYATAQAERLKSSKAAVETQFYDWLLAPLTEPALALVGEHGWVWACALLVIQRMGKAIKKPAKDTILSFAASQEGVGKSFGIQEVLDQIGAFLGPVLLYLVMLFKTDGTTFQVYSTCFAVLAIPGAITLVLLLVTKRKFPNPEHFEPEPKEYVPFKMKKEFVLYIAGISLFAFGFIDYSLVLMHVSRTYTHLASGLAQTSALVSSGSLPLLYAGAMLVDAVAALVFGLLYDKKGVQALVWSTVLSAPFAVFVFACHSVGALLVGIALWGVGMGAQESILKAAVTQMVPKASRATGYGVFECAFGVFWFLGSWLLGVLYDVSIPAMVAVSVAAQLAATPLYLRSAKLYRDGLKGENA